MSTEAQINEPAIDMQGVYLVLYPAPVNLHVITSCPHSGPAIGQSFIGEETSALAILSRAPDTGIHKNHCASHIPQLKKTEGDKDMRPFRLNPREVSSSSFALARQALLSPYGNGTSVARVSDVPFSRDALLD